MGAPETPRDVVSAPSTPPPLIRESLAFLHPHVCFLEALTGEALEGVTETTIAGVKNQIATMTDVLPMQVVLLDMYHAAIVLENRHSFAAEVLVYINERMMPSVPEFPKLETAA